MTNRMEYPLSPALPNRVRAMANKSSNEYRLQKRESDPDAMADPEGRAGLGDIAKPLSQSPMGQSPLSSLASGMMPKKIIMGTFQAAIIEPSTGDLQNLAGGLQNFQGLLGGGGGGTK
ncbi:uncharacterized protein LOC123301136 [Chrysoperla carnea]|uniref:uncharacterized protein LOC123301136 n=1 Tax=Chrysoperla carnea TaxID=189513 RepID=UPI001D07F13A|nr:uncharacterized protein LOC123301136 [Chrysoperla carnea]